MLIKESRDTLFKSYNFMFKYYLAALKKYATFSGRARRKEFWYFGLMNFIIALCLCIPIYYGIFKMVFTLVSQGNNISEEAIIEFVLNNMGYSIIFYVIYILYALAVFVPGLAVSVRRLHDVGKSGWFFLIPYLGILLNLIPIIGSFACLGLSIWFLVLMCTNSQVGENKYGSDPKAEERNI